MPFDETSWRLPEVRARKYWGKNNWLNHDRPSWSRRNNNWIELNDWKIDWIDSPGGGFVRPGAGEGRLRGGLHYDYNYNYNYIIVNKVGFIVHIDGSTSHQVLRDAEKLSGRWFFIIHYNAGGWTMHSIELPPLLQIPQIKTHNLHHPCIIHAMWQKTFLAISVWS